MSGTHTGEANRVGAEAGERSGDLTALDHADPSATSAPSFPHFAATTGSSSSASDTYAPPPPPSRRDLPAVDAPTSNAASASASDSTHNTVGSRVSGLFNAIHGAGEAIRGTINSGLDGLGDGIAGRPQGTVDSRSSAAGEETIAQKGAREFQDGVAALKGETTASSRGTGTA